MTDTANRTEVRELLDFAVELAHEAGDLTLQYYGKVVEHDAKGDGSPVTVADREAERLIRARVEKRFPEHAILGEEYGESNEGARVRWILDPIDATRSFMRGVPLYGVLIGIEVEGVSAVGVAHFPPLRETVAAGTGLGCTWNGNPCRVSEVSTLEQSVICTTDVERILSKPQGAGWRRIQQKAAFSRTWGDCYGHMLVATGRIEGGSGHGIMGRRAVSDHRHGGRRTLHHVGRRRHRPRRIRHQLQRSDPRPRDGGVGEGLSRSIG